ncbi:helix-turn-helix domain-containing protein [Caulobacter endophyticus]|uniref:helix-turn-helix domain-containing protein n=1 Tax=Caulobacter endophyticus TaxID=2172652 RepID=UPI002410AEEB|nr:AraC family transcriptional regulator [Caulobacter endophyticus]MDG2527908.1 AraC family transcriptional regulator [Caulobacter endophyticus]
MLNAPEAAVQQQHLMVDVDLAEAGSEAVRAEMFSLARAVMALADELGRPSPAVKAVLDRARFVLGQQDCVPSGDSPLAPWQLRRVLAHVERHIDRAITIPELARQANLSTSYFSRAFRQSQGVTAGAYVRNRRIEHAKQMLRDSSTSLAQISGACGFSDQAHFTRVFSALVGLPPHRWRRSGRGAHLS